jgi:hypothetical protein
LNFLKNTQKQLVIYYDFSILLGSGGYEQNQRTAQRWFENSKLAIKGSKAIAP